MYHVIAYIGTAMSIGTLGNLLVIFIFGFRYRKSAFNTLIVQLAIYDLLSCVVHMPLDIVGMYSPDLLPNSSLCKTACTLIAVTVIASSIVLAAVALIRYRGVHKPLARNLNITEARWLGVLVLVPAAAMAWPSVFMYTNETIESEMNITMCGIHDLRYRDYGIGYTSVLLGLFFANFLCLTVVYLVIARIIIRRKRVFALSGKHTGSIAISSIMDTKIGTKQTNCSPDINNDRLAVKKALINNPVGSSSPTTPIPMVFQKQRGQQMKKKEGNNKPPTLTRSNANNGLLMMFLVTFIFCVSYLPHLGYSLYFLFCDEEEIIKLVSRNSFGILVRSYYINSFANPVIYGMCSGEFRAEIVQSLKSNFHTF